MYSKIINELCEISQNLANQDKLKSLNKYLEKLFKLNKSKDEIYKELVGYERKFNDWTHEKNIELQEICKQIRSDEIYFNSNYNWSQVHLRGRDIFSFIKVYVSLKQSNIADIFIKSVARLLKTSKSFATKVSNQGRFETFIFWVDKEDFLVLQEILSPYEKYKPLKFVANFGDFGISKEFSSSQNDAISELLSTHFSMINNEKEVDVLKLFDIAIKKTDAREYNFNPLTLVIIVKTLFLILGKTTMNINDFLLNDSENLWSHSLDIKRDYSKLKNTLSV